jgi:phage-related holin
MQIVILGVKSFFEHFFAAMHNVFFVIVSMLAFLIGYPAQKAILTFALVLFVLDIVTKFNAIRVQEKGLWKAFMNGRISSRSFWDGFITKSISYFTILVMANLAHTTPELGVVGDGLATIFYVGLAFYETISNGENLRDAGFLAIVPILNKLKKEQDKFLDSSIESTKETIEKQVVSDNKPTTTGGGVG